MSATAAKPEEPTKRIIRELEESGDLDPDCQTCAEHFYPSYLAGKGCPFAPAHKASSRCESGKHAHCSCDMCF